MIDAELTQLSNVFSGRILVINDEFRIVKDTYELDEGKTVVSEDVIRCYKGKGTTLHDKENHLIEVTVPIKRCLLYTSRNLIMTIYNIEHKYAIEK